VRARRPGGPGRSRKREEIGRAGVIAKFGVPPESIADYLALVGDSADGYPGLPGWGAKSAAAVLSKFGHLTDIPRSSGDWGLPALRGCDKLAVTLRDHLDLALLFRRIATSRPTSRWASSTTGSGGALTRASSRSPPISVPRCSPNVPAASPPDSDRADHRDGSGVSR
jgi:hypothetical protein